MDDDIKEILDKLEIVARKHTIEVCDDGSKIETMPASIVDELRLNNWSAKLLLDYITNLQQENEIVHKDFEELSQRYFFTKSRIEKADWYLLESLECLYHGANFTFDELIHNTSDILNGRSDE